MRALVRHLTAATYLAARAGRFPAGLRLAEVDPPELPGPDWVRLQPILAGVCGTDVAALRARLSRTLLPTVSFPSVPGHEILAREVPGGRRVAVDPFLGCAARGVTPPCPACAAGLPARCDRFAAGRLAPGNLMGFCRDVPGGWCTETMAPLAQVHPVPDAVGDARAVLTEPLAVALHAVLQHPPERGSRVAVVGCGTVGLLTVAALRALALDAQPLAVARHPAQIRLLAALGGGVAQAGPFDQLYDCAGTARSLHFCLRETRPGGHVVLVGTTGMAGIDWTGVWSRELTIHGALGYGRETWEGRSLHTFDLALEILAARPDIPVERLVTHRFPLSAYRTALDAAARLASSGAVKVVLHPDPPGSAVERVPEPVAQAGRT